jgi:glyceraldehyde 3-phosphate dehydrogenase
LTAKTAAILLEEDRKRVGSDIRVTLTADELVLGDTRFRILAIRKIEEAPWAELGADIIVESIIGKYAVPRAHFHLEAGAARVVIYEG